MESKTIHQTGLRKIFAGEIYRHVEGACYQVLHSAIDLESGNLLVIFQAQTGNRTIYAMPYSTFAAKIDHNMYPDAKQEHCFEAVDSQRLQMMMGDSHE